MAPGKSLSCELKTILCDIFRFRGKTVQQVHEDVLNFDTTKVSITYLEKLRRFFRRSTWQECLDFCSVEKAKTRPLKRKMNPFDRQELERLSTADNSKKPYQLRQMLKIGWYAHPNDIARLPSRRTIAAELKILGITRKKKTLIPGLINHTNRHAYHQKMKHIDPHSLVNFDETASSSKHLQEKFGYAKRGKRARQYLLFINGRHYTALAAYTTRGWLCYAVYEGAITHEHVENFFIQELGPRLRPNYITILDNSSLHHQFDCFNTIHQVTGGKYQYLEPYCHRDAPVERGFQNVKAYVRSHEQRALVDPVTVILEAFHYYSIGQPGGVAAHNHFRGYFRRHKAYLG